jgi:hypothetical protein
MTKSSQTRVEKKILDKAGILAINDTKIEELFVPEWNSTVYIKSLKLNELLDYLNKVSQFQKEGTGSSEQVTEVELTFIGYALCDQDGNKLFNKDELTALAGKNALAISRIFSAAKVLSGMEEEKSNPKN